MVREAPGPPPVTLQSVWQASRLGERTKHQRLERFVLGVPVYRLARTCCAYGEHWREPFEGCLECDETTFAGAKKGKRGWGAAGKVMLLGILKRNGEVKVFAVKARSGQRLIRLVCTHTWPGSLYYSDSWQAYAPLAVRGDHIVVRKEGGRPKGRDHINGIEGFWSDAKHWLYPYRGVPRRFFHLYPGEVCYRFNHRAEDLVPLVLQLMKRLDYATLRPLSARNG